MPAYWRGADGEPVAQRRSLGAQGVRDVVEPQLGVVFQMAGQGLGLPAQRAGRTRGQRQDVPPGRLGRPGRFPGGWCLLDDDMGVGAAYPEGADRGTARTAGVRPFLQLGRHPERT